MFEYAFVEAHGRSVRPGTFVASLAGELGVVGLSILLPLLFVDVLPQAGWLLQHMPLVAPPPGKQVSEAPVVTPAPARPVRPAASNAKLFEPVRYPAKPAILVDPEPGWAAPGSGDRGGVPFGTGDPQGAPNPVIADLLRNPVPAPPPLTPVKPEAPPAPAPPPLLRIGGNVHQPEPLYTPQPEYPVLARQTRVSGVVKLEAIVATDGTIRSLKLLSGHALLVRAAMAAVRTWRYTPPTLNGNPIEIQMFVDVHFNLGH